MNDVLLYIRNFAYSHNSANVSAADRAKQYKKSEVFEDGGILYSAMCNTNLKRFLEKSGKNNRQKVRA